MQHQILIQKLNQKHIKHSDQIDQLEKKNRNDMFEARWQLDEMKAKCQ